MATRHPFKYKPSPEFIHNQEQLARNPLAWRLRAMSQQRAAELLQDQSRCDWQGRISNEAYVPFGTGEIESPYIPRLEAVIHLLQAQAIQSLLTAMCIERDGALEDSAHAFDVLQKHTLLDLCEQLGIDLEGGEFLMLEHMDSAFMCSDRYPLPLVHYALHPKPLPGFGTLVRLTSSSLLEYLIVGATDFLVRLWKLYEEIVPVPEQLR